MLQTFDARNNDIQIFIKNNLFAREDAKVSVFDSTVQGGDAVWEGLRLYSNGIFALEDHIKRLLDSAKALHFADVPSREFIIQALQQTIQANEMTDGVHIRMTLSRGEKITSGMDPRLNQSGSVLMIVPEYKTLIYDNDSGITVLTSSMRRNNPAFLDSKIHHNNLLNNILAKIQANVAGKDAALLLDKDGFVAELNGTNLFMVKHGILMTPFANACLPGITRGVVMNLAAQNKIPTIERNISLTECYTADELFCTGTMGELTPIMELDGRKIENDRPVMQRISQLFHQFIPQYCTPMA